MSDNNDNTQMGTAKSYSWQTGDNGVKPTLSFGDAPTFSLMPHVAVDISALSADASKYKDTFAILRETLRQAGYDCRNDGSYYATRRIRDGKIENYTTWAEFFRACMAILMANDNEGA